MANNLTQTTRWSEDALANLPKEGVFRLRGLEVTRLDTFVDAAFAFVLTLLVISFDDIPSNYEEMIGTVKGIPSFLASFIMLMIFWLSHRGWSRRFGLENGMTLLISLAVIFTILVYVYPLRMVFESAFAYLSNGYFTTTFTMQTYTELRGMFMYYSAGLLVMSLLFCALYRVTLRSNSLLSLNGEEELAMAREASAWALCAIIALISILLANVVADERIGFAGWVYLLTYPLIAVVNRVSAK